ncbi:hypothetical protein Aph01nite_18330 [Acrocarpospora phusangensis]|uniref:PASTA domain-containing protein n=1 Tax=Acrocarpospora phusangensis TaxID=1070424 RepID=A0A919UMP5_9ACTN|nr:hypothetical protein [Acrocarpospora phusangensis]GIH23523.1 hypothetical protein Aph01nite_18330 [Acrocarpospora phusangensis]
MVERRSRCVEAIAAVLLALIAGCAACAQPADPYDGDLRRALSQATSDFERQVLTDRRITRAEYEEAVRRYVACMQANGIGFEAVDQGLGYYVYVETPTSPDHNTINPRCQRGTTLLIEPIYTGMVTNPAKADPRDLVAKCLILKGLAPEEYSAGDLAADAAADYRNAPFDGDDPRVRTCHQNPSIN